MRHHRAAADVPYCLKYNTTPDILFWMLGVFGVTLILGVAFAAFNRARKATVAAVGGGRKGRRG